MTTTILYNPELKHIALQYQNQQGVEAITAYEYADVAQAFDTFDKFGPPQLDASQSMDFLSKIGFPRPLASITQSLITDQEQRLGVLPLLDMNVFTAGAPQASATPPQTTTKATTNEQKKILLNSVANEFSRLHRAQYRKIMQQNRGTVGQDQLSGQAYVQASIQAANMISSTISSQEGFANNKTLQLAALQKLKSLSYSRISGVYAHQNKDNTDVTLADEESTQINPALNQPENKILELSFEDFKIFVPKN